jgi:hypothetical protein
MNLSLLLNSSSCLTEGAEDAGAELFLTLPEAEGSPVTLPSAWQHCSGCSCTREHYRTHISHPLFYKRPNYRLQTHFISETKVQR